VTTRGKLFLWSYNGTTGYWVQEREVQKSTADAWLSIFSRDKPNVRYRIASTKPTKPPKMAIRMNPHRKRNSLTGRYVIAARRTKSSPRLYFTGKALDNTDPPRVFTRWKSAVLAARALERRYPHIIGRYYVSIESYKGHAGRKRNPHSKLPALLQDAIQRVGHGGETAESAANWVWFQGATKADREAVDKWVVDSGHPSGMEPGTPEHRFKQLVKEFSRKKNPSRRAGQIQEAARRFSEFSGHDPETTRTIEVKVPPVMLAVGELDGLLYTTVRDHKREAYIHKFKKSARPLLAASHDGRSLSIVGGRFEFTEAGIEDR
jgi:hypothetical protein